MPSLQPANAKPERENPVPSTVAKVLPINLPVNCVGIVPVPLPKLYVTVRPTGFHLA